MPPPDRNCFSSWWITATRCGAAEHPLLAYLVTSVATLFIVVLAYMTIRCCCLYHQNRRRQLQQMMLTMRGGGGGHGEDLRQMEEQQRRVMIQPLNNLALGAAIFESQHGILAPAPPQIEQPQHHPPPRVCVIMAGEESPSFIAQPSPLPGEASSKK